MMSFVLVTGLLSYTLGPWPQANFMLRSGRLERPRGAGAEGIGSGQSLPESELGQGTGLGDEEGPGPWLSSLLLW